MWPCFSRMLESNTTTQDKISYLRMISFCQNMRLKNEEDIKIIVSQIQALIDSPMTRYDGLLLWNCALSKSELYVPNWGKILTAGLQCNDSFGVKEQCSIVLRKMVLVFGKLTAYSGAFSRFLPDIITILLADSEANQGFVNSCESLKVCMIHFPHLFGSYMAEIETFVMSNLNTDSIPTIETLSDLFSTFPRSLELTIKPKVLLTDVFQTTFIRATNTLHSLMNDILSFQNGNCDRVVKTPKFEIPLPAEDGIPLLYNKIRTLASFSRCLAKMMSSQKSKVRASIEDLLGLISRMFAIDFNDEVTNRDGELALLFLAFPKICDAAFTLLEALVLNFRVDEQAVCIMVLVMKVINISRTSPHSPLFYSQVRSTTFKFLNIWIHQNGGRVTSEMVSTKLVQELLFEIELHSTDREIKDQTVKLFQYSSCLQALKTLANLHVSGSCFMEAKDVEDIITTVLRTVTQVQLHMNPSKSFPCPYSNEECRKELYSLLLTYSISDNPSQMKYALKCVHLFKTALRDPSIKVKEVCHKSFAVCRYFLHPKKPPPDYLVHPKPAEVNQVIEEENLLDDWGTGWENGQLNGHAPASENAAISSYLGESSFTEAREMDHDGQTEQDSPPHYTELGPVNVKKTFSQHSSQSYAEDSDSDDDKDSSCEEEEEHPSRKKVYAVVAPRARPTIQILETHSRACEQPAEDSMELGVNVEKAMPELSDGYEEEEDIALTENGEPESDEGEDYVEEEDEVEEEEEGELIEEGQFAETEEPPTKKQRVDTDEFSLEEESSCKNERGEMVMSDVCQEAASNVDHQEEISSTQEAVGSDEHQEAFGSDERQEAFGSDERQEAFGSDERRETFGSDEHQEAFGSDEHQEAFGSDEHQETIGGDENREPVDGDLQGSINNDDHQSVEGDNHQGTLSNEVQEELSNDGHQEEAISNQEINGENEDSDDSSSNEPVSVLPPITLTVDEMLQDFILVPRERS